MEQNSMVQGETPRNKDQKCPIVLVLDTSGSMEGTALTELNTALQKFKDEILADPLLTSRMEVGIVCFDDDARVERPIDLISTETVMPTLTTGGTTNVVSGMRSAMQIIEDRKVFYKSNNEQYYRPFICLITDGIPTNTPEEIDALDNEIQQMADNKKFIFIPFGVGEADMALLAKLAAQTADQRLKEKAVAYKMTGFESFAKVFAFVSSSISAAMVQGAAQTVQMDPNVAQAVTFDLSN
jgi:uncharacterized protein YegL